MTESTIDEIEKKVTAFMQSKAGQRSMVQSAKETAKIIGRLDKSVKVEERLLDIEVAI